MKKINLFKIIDRKRKSDTLPLNRRGSYFDVVKNQPSKTILLSIIVSLFFAPFVLFYILKSLYFINLPPVDDSAISGMRNLVFTVITGTLYFPLLVVGFIGLGTAFVFSKDLLMQKPNVSIIKDFSANRKLIFKESIITSFIFWLGLFLLKVNFAFYPLVEMSNIVYPFAIVVILGFCFLTIYSLFILASGTLYKNTFRSLMHNNFLFTFYLLPKNIVFTLISVCLLLILRFVPYVLLQMISGMLIIIFGMSHLPLSFMAYALKTFDKYINNEYARELVNKGLGIKEANDGNITL